MEASDVGVWKTPFHDVMSEAGAEFTELFGALWPDHFGDLEAEYRAQREDVGVFDASPINKWEFRGRDAVVAAQRVHTNNIIGSDFGQVRYGAFCDDAGRMIDDGMVFKVSPELVWVMTNKNTRAEHFASSTSDLDVEISYITPQLPHLFFQGPRSRDALAPITDADLSKLRYFRFLPEPVAVAGVPVWLSRTGVSGELGYELFCRPDDAPELLRRLLKKTGARPYGLSGIEPVRIEAGMIATDIDYPEHTYTPYDFSFDRLVDLGQEFVGRDALATLSSESPAFRFTTLRLDSKDLPEYRSDILHSGTTVGMLTSPTVSPHAGPIALAVVSTPLAVPGTRLEIADGPVTCGATVHTCHPAYDPEKRRPRT